MQSHWDVLRALEGTTLTTITGRPFLINQVTCKQSQCVCHLTISSGKTVVVDQSELQLVVDHVQAGGALNPGSLRAAGAKHCSYIGALAARVLGVSFASDSNDHIKYWQKASPDFQLDGDEEVQLVTSIVNTHHKLEVSGQLWDVMLRTRLDESGCSITSYWIRSGVSEFPDEEAALSAAIQDIECLGSKNEMRPCSQSKGLGSGTFEHGASRVAKPYRNANSSAAVVKIPRIFVNNNIDMVAFARELADISPWFKSRLLEIIIARYDRGETLQQIGDQLGISRERVRQLEKKAIRQMITRLELSLKNSN